MQQKKTDLKCSPIQFSYCHVSNIFLFIKLCYKKKNIFSLIELLDQEVQRTSNTTTKEPRENSTNPNTANEKKIPSNTVGYGQPEDMAYKTEQSGSCNGQAELPALPSDLVDLDQRVHQPKVKKGGKKNCKAELSEIVPVHEKTGKEMTSLTEESK